jgi:Fe-S-cluster containining protein
MPRKKTPSAASPAGGGDLEARRVQRLKTKVILGAGKTPLHVIDLAASAVTVNDEALQETMIREPRRPPPACREGCTWCCYQRVGTAAPEVLRIAAYLRQTLSGEELQAACERIRLGAAQRRAQGRRPLPCPLLVGDLCQAYPVRPLTCRGFNSSDAHRCEAAVTQGSRVPIPVYAPQQRLATFVLDGLRAGAQESGLDGESLELTAALHLALTVPDAMDRWLAGQPVFAEARLR